MQKKLALFLTMTLASLNIHNEFTTKDYSTFAAGALVGTLVFKTIEPYVSTLNPFKSNNKKVHTHPVNELESLFQNGLQTTIHKPNSINLKFDNIAGLVDAKNMFYSIMQQINSSITLGNSLPSSIFLTGPSGVGKTLLVQAFAGETNYLCIKTTCDNLTAVLSQQKINSFIEKLKACGPCILFVDDIDCLNGSTGTLFNELIASIQYVQDKQRPIFFISASNNPHVLEICDSFKSNKLDYYMLLRNPHINDRIALINMYLQTVKHDPTIDSKKFAEQTQGATGYEIQRLINSAAKIALEKGASFVTMRDLYEALNTMTLGTKTNSYLCSKEEKLQTAYHEAGHALAALLLPSKWLTFNLISTESRHWCLGVVKELEIDRHFTKEDALQFIAVCMGGKAAEELIFNMNATGPSMDLQMATDLARKIICRLGMTDVVGKQVVNPNSMVCSQKTLEKIDEAITNMLEEQYQLTKQLLIDNRDKLDKLAYAVVEKEILYADEVYEVLGIEPKKYTMLI